VLLKKTIREESIGSDRVVQSAGKAGVLSEEDSVFLQEVVFGRGREEQAQIRTASHSE